MIDDAEDLDLVVPMHNLLEYNLNRSDTTVSLLFYSKDEATNFNNITTDDACKFFKYKAKLLGNTEDDGVNGILWNSNSCAVKVSEEFLEITSNAFE